MVRSREPSDRGPRPDPAGGADPPTASPSTIGAQGATAFCESGSGNTKPVMARSAMTATPRQSRCGDV